jgi:hypothetical protein
VKATPYLGKKRRVICRKTATVQPVLCKLILILSTFLSSQRVCCRLYYTMTSAVIKWRGITVYTLRPCSDWRRFRHFKWITHSATVICHNSWNAPGPYHVTVCTYKKKQKSCTACPLFQMTFIHFKLLLGAFTNSKKRLLASSCQSVRTHETTRLPLEGFLWNLILEDFSRICWENSSLIKIGQE